MYLQASPEFRISRNEASKESPRFRLMVGNIKLADDCVGNRKKTRQTHGLAAKTGLIEA
jgi:hypothetical protein